MLQAQSDKIKLQLRVEELQHKYEPKGNQSPCFPMFLCVMCYSHTCDIKCNIMPWVSLLLKLFTSRVKKECDGKEKERETSCRHHTL